MRPVLLALALAGWSAPALAQTVPVAFTPPAQVKLLDSAVLVSGSGKGDGTDCAGAFKLALADAKSTAEKKKCPVLVAVYGDKPSGDWTSATSVSCSQKGKHAVVKLTALAVHPGDGAAWPTISGARQAAIVRALVGEDGAGQVNHVQIDALTGRAWFAFEVGGREESFNPQVSRNTRAVRMLQQMIEPKIAGVVAKVAPLSEITGIHMHAEDNHIVGSTDTPETFHVYVPTEVAQGFAKGSIKEQALADRSVILWQGDAKPEEIRVSFAQAK